MERKDLPAVQLTRPVINFEEDCLDPISQLVLVEALDYAVETSMGRLESLGKIFPKVKMSGANALAAVNAIRESINKTPKCKAPDEPLGKIIPPKAPPKKEKEPEVKKREGPPEVWGEAYYIDKGGEKHGPFGSPTEMGRELGVDVKGARDMVKQFELLGCRVTTNGEGKPIEKGKGFVVRWQPRCKLPTSPEVVPPEAKKVEPKEERKYKQPYVKIKDAAGKLIRWEDADGTPLPKEFWPGATSSLEDNPKGRPFGAATALAAKQAVAEKQEPKSVGSIINKSVWDAMSVDGRAILARHRGMEGKVGSKSWNELTAEEQSRLQGA